MLGRQIRKGWGHRGVELNRGWGLGYGVVEAVVEAVDASADGEEEAVEAPFAGTNDGLASMITVRVLVLVLRQVSVAT